MHSPNTRRASTAIQRELVHVAGNAAVQHLDRDGRAVQVFILLGLVPSLVDDLVKKKEKTVKKKGKKKRVS